MIERYIYYLGFIIEYYIYILYTMYYYVLGLPKGGVG